MCSAKDFIRGLKMKMPKAFYFIHVLALLFASCDLQQVSQSLSLSFPICKLDRTL